MMLYYVCICYLILFEVKDNYTYIFIRLLNTHEELKKNWNTYKQKQTNNKTKLRLESLHIIY